MRMGGGEGCRLRGLTSCKALATSPAQQGFISLLPTSRGGDPHREGFIFGSRTRGVVVDSGEDDGGRAEVVGEGGAGIRPRHIYHMRT